MQGGTHVPKSHLASESLRFFLSFFDRLHHTKSKMVRRRCSTDTAIQRTEAHSHRLYLSVIAPTLVEKAAAGEHVTVGEYKGDFLANSNKGDRTSKHNGVLRSRPECHPGALGWQHHPRGQGEARGDAAPQRHVRD